MPIKSHLLSAGRWTTASSAFRILIQYTQIVILARILSPNDFGHMAIVMGAIGIANIVADCGLSSALLHFPNPDKRELSTLYWINLIAASILCALFIWGAQYLADFYHKKEITLPLVLMSLLFPINALGNQFRVLSEKNLQFKSLAFTEIAASGIAFIITVIVALISPSIYTLVVSALVSASARSALYIFFLSQPLPSLSFDFEKSFKYLRYGVYKLCETLVSTINNQIDIFLGGHIAAGGSLGFYSTSRDLNLNIANSFINPVITRISTPLMSQLQGDLYALKNIYCQTLKMTSSINFPIYFFVGIFSKDIVEILLGPKWDGAELFFCLFAVWGGIRSIGNPTGSLLYATGNVQRAFWWNIGLLIFNVTVLYLFFIWNNFKLMAIGMICVQVIIFVPMWRFLVYPICPIPLKEYFGQLSPALTSTLIAGLISKLFTDNCPLKSTLFNLCVGGVIFFAIYYIASLKFNANWIRSFHELTRIPPK